jgi:hypothetical protein
MSQTLVDLSAYPISAATRRQLERPLFGHVIDGEVVPSLDGSTMPVIARQQGAGPALRLGCRRRAAVGPRVAFDDGRQYLAPLEKEGRLLHTGTGRRPW